MQKKTDRVAPGVLGCFVAFYLSSQVRVMMSGGWGPPPRVGRGFRITANGSPSPGSVVGASAPSASWKRTVQWVQALFAGGGGLGCASAARVGSEKVPAGGAAA